MATPRLRDWQLDLLRQLVEAEDAMLAKGERGELLVMFPNGPCRIRHPGLAGELQAPDGDIKALRWEGALHIGIEGSNLWRGELSSSARQLLEDEEEARGTPSAATQLAELREQVAATARQRAERRRHLARSLTRPVRWFAFALPAVLILVVAWVSLTLTDQAIAPVAIVAVGIGWAAIDRLKKAAQWARAAHTWAAERIDAWLTRQLD